MNVQHFLCSAVVCLLLFGCKPAETPSSAVITPAAVTKVAEAPPEPKTAPCQLKLGFESWEPYQYVGLEQKASGLDIEIVQAVAGRMNCTLVLQHGTWQELLGQFRQGQLDVLSHLSFSEQRKQQFAFIGPHHTEAIYLVGDPAALPASSQLSDLIDKVDYGRIAVLHGAYYGEEFAQLSQQPALQRQLVVISSIQDKLALLRAGRVNAILEDISVLHYWQQHHYPDAGQYQPLLKVYESPVYFGFSKAALPASTLARLAQAWQRLYQQGELTAIYQKYHISNYADLIPASIL